ncbi:hypothetical protein EES44_02890 [Streptomyces sp. ADI96-15]|nr:hypothetical protein EES44_02890 [Streptomyces sp. ADI96-15]
MWWRVSISVAPSGEAPGASRTSRTRISGPVRRSNGRIASARSAARASSAEPGSATRTGTSRRAWTVCVPRPSTGVKVVRSASWRVTRPATAVRSAGRSRVPVSRSVVTTLYSPEPGANSSRNHRRSCAKESGSAPSRGALGTGPPEPGPFPAGAASTAAAREATVGWSKSVLGERSAPSRVRSRETTFSPAMESPPSVKKSWWAPTRPAPSTSAQTSATTVCVPGSGAVYCAPSSFRPPSASPGAGSARRSTLPLTVSGSAASSTRSEGTMYAGSRPARSARTAGTSSAAPPAGTTYATSRCDPERLSRAATATPPTSARARSAASISPSSTRWPRIFTWPSPRPRKARRPSGPRRTTSPERYSLWPEPKGSATNRAEVSADCPS